MPVAGVPVNVPVPSPLLVNVTPPGKPTPPRAIDGAGKVVFRRTVRRDQLTGVVAGLAPCVIGMEACSGAHDWGRRFQGLVTQCG